MNKFCLTPPLSICYEVNFSGAREAKNYNKNYAVPVTIVTREVRQNLFILILRSFIFCGLFYLFGVRAIIIINMICFFNYTTHVYYVLCS